MVRCQSGADFDMDSGWHGSSHDKLTRPLDANGCILPLRVINFRYKIGSWLHHVVFYEAHGDPTRLNAMGHPVLMRLQCAGHPATASHPYSYPQQPDRNAQGSTDSATGPLFSSSCAWYVGGCRGHGATPWPIGVHDAVAVCVLRDRRSIA